MDVTVVVATYGGREWQELAESRAVPSAVDQAPVVRVHGDTLAKARNEGLSRVRGEWVIYLDADDELEPGYVDAMGRGTADLRYPYVRQLRNGRARRPPFLPQVWGHSHACRAECIRQGNFMVIGTAVRAQMLRDAGGWEEWGWSEDWAMFARCVKAGATVEAIRGAVYRAHVSHGSRNHRLSNAETVRWHREIERAVWPEEFAA